MWRKLIKNEKRRKSGKEEEAGFAQMGKIEEEQINKLKKRGNRERKKKRVVHRWEN